MNFTYFFKVETLNHNTSVFFGKSTFIRKMFSSPSQMFFKISFLKMFSFFKYHRRTSVLESLFNKVRGIQACNFIKKRLQHRCFLVKLAPFLQNTSGGCFYLLSNIQLLSDSCEVFVPSYLISCKNLPKSQFL